MSKKSSLAIPFILIFFSFNLPVEAETYRIQIRPPGQEYWGYCDLEGKIVIPPTYRKCEQFSQDGYAVVLNPFIDEFRFIDSLGQILILPDNVSKIRATGFSNGLAAVKVGRYWGFIDLNAKFVYPPKFTKVYSAFSDGYAAVSHKSQRIIIDKYGNETVIADPDVDYIKSFNEGIAAYLSKSNGNWGFIDTTGIIRIRARYRSVGNFSSGLVWVKDHLNNCGYINNKGAVVIPLKFTVAYNFDPISELARIKFGEEWKHINKSGVYFSLTGSINKDFHEGLTIGKMESLVGFLKGDGSWVIEPQYRAVRHFKNGYAAAKGMNEMWGVIDRKGTWVISPKFLGIKDVEIIK